MVPRAPHDLRSQRSPDGSFSLTWKSAGDDLTGFVIERSPDGYRWQQVARLDQEARSYSAQSPNDNAVDCYRGRAVNPHGPSFPSRVVGASDEGRRGADPSARRLEDI